MYWKKSISDIVAAFVVQMLFFILALAAGLLGAQTLVAHEGSSGMMGGGSMMGQGGDFTLNSADGPLSLNELRGKVVLLFFGYTSCPDVCPLSLSTIDRVFSKMTPEELKRVQALFISLDPEKDTLEKLKKYTGYFHPNIVGVTEKLEVVAKVAEQYGFNYKKKIVPNSALGYVIAHPADIFVVGPDGKLRNTFPHNADTKPLLNRIRSLLNAER
jgi:protein SCO1/2